MKVSKFLIIMTALAAICLLALTTSLLHAEPVPGGEQVQQRAFKLPQLFDFQYYKEKFGKRYKSLVDELVHRTYFVARAFRAYITGMKYKFRELSYCLAVNHLSDASPQELDALKNKKLASERLINDLIPPVARKSPATEKVLPELLPYDGKNYERKVQELLETYPDNKKETRSRSKRDTESSLDEKEAPRDLSLDDLVKPGVNEIIQEPAEVQEKITEDVETNNPHYQQPEVSQTFGPNDNDYVELSAYLMPPAEEGESQNETQTKQELGDVMYFDHRDSNCLMQPRNQGRCCSCYAFASMALMEWLYCKKTGKLVPFSEQYLLDCGNKRFENELWGCDGGSDYGTFEFIANYGVERAKDYPYSAREHQCRYDKDTSIKASGYIKMDLSSYTLVPVSRWAEYIKYAPLYIAVAVPADFPEFSTGVHDGLNCDNEPNHAMLVVGHGREDGTEFWLLRNSFGPNWGVGGHFRLSKDAPLRCIHRQIGYALGTSDALNYHVNPAKNSENKMLRWLKEGFFNEESSSSRESDKLEDAQQEEEKENAQDAQWKYK